MGCVRALPAPEVPDLPTFAHEASDPHCLGVIITGPTVLQESIWFVEVQLDSDPNIIVPAITSREVGLDTGDRAAVWFIRISRMKYFPIGDTIEMQKDSYYDPIVLAEKPHPEWTRSPSHPVYCPRRNE